MKKANNNIVFLPIFLSLFILLLSIGYASINSITSEISGKLNADKQEGIFITDIKYYSNYDALTNESDINNYYQTTMNSTIALSKTNPDSTITYEITVYNSTDDDYRFNQVLYAPEFYDNEDITFSLIDLKKRDRLISKGFLTFYITFSYVDGIYIENNILNSFLNFEFIKVGTGDGLLELVYTIEPAWSEGNLHFYKCDFTLTNVGDIVIDSWSIDLPISIEYNYNSGWGDGYNVKLEDQSGNINVSSNEMFGLGAVVKFSIQIGVYSETFDFEDIFIDSHKASSDNGSGEGEIPDIEDEPDVSLTTSGIEITFDKANSWNAGENVFYNQYNVIITNTTNEVITDWQVAIEVPYGSKIEQSWNLNYVNYTNYVIIKPLSTNPSLNPLTSYSDGGFIINITDYYFEPVVK